MINIPGLEKMDSESRAQAIQAAVMAEVGSLEKLVLDLTRKLEQAIKDSLKEKADRLEAERQLSARIEKYKAEQKVVSPVKVEVKVPEVKLDSSWIKLIPKVWKWVTGFLPKK